MQLSPTKLNYLQRCFICTWHFFVCETRVSVNFSLYQWRILCILRGVVFTVGCMCYDSFFLSVVMWGCFDVFIIANSYQYNDVSTSRSPSLFSSAWLVRHLVTWQRTVGLSPTSALADVDQQTQRPVAPHVQRLWRPMLRSCQSTATELAANQSKTVSQSGTIQALVKDFPDYSAWDHDALYSRL